MKAIAFFSLLIFLSQSTYGSNPSCEIYVNNRLPGANLFIRFYPVGALFQIEVDASLKTPRYSIRSQDFIPGNNSKTGVSRKLEEHQDSNRLKYLVGLDGFALNNRGNIAGFFRLESDIGIDPNYYKWLLLGNDASANQLLDGLFGIGKYVLEIWTESSMETGPEIVIPIDWDDFNYPYFNEDGGAKDLKIRIYGLDSTDITFQWAGMDPSDGDELPLFGSGSPPYNGGIQVYKQYHRYINGQWEGYNLNGEHPPSGGNSLTDKYFLSYPIDGRDLPAPYTIPRHDSSGNFHGNLTIDTNVSTSPELYDQNTELTFYENTYLRINGGDTLTLSTPDLPSGGNVSLIMKPASRLSLGGTVIVENRNVLRLKAGSSVKPLSGSAILMKSGSLFCNEGAEIQGELQICYAKGTHAVCDLTNDIANSDSTHIVLDSATLTLPDDFTLHLSGNETALILNPGSKLLFGENSGIVCDSGAKIIANDATFASVDTTKKWNGISLNDLASDTIKNCTIKNAMYGIMISERYDSEESPDPYSAQISGCSFVNQTSYVLNNAIYLQNSAHVLLKDNIITSNNLSIGFTHGIYAEYCPGEMLNIINNNISNCNNGMTIIQSSPYIAFNTLNGNSYGESGMFLDNSNGTIKYNFISDFYNSYYSFYSSPDLLKNTFDNSCDDNVYLSSSSVPVMHPLQSGGSVYWYAGDNHITGSPYDAGILFDADAYPDMNYGYNRITLTGSNYYLSGVNPSASGREFYVYENYWGEVPADSLMFNITGADVKFNPYDDNSQSARHTNTFDKTDIGFGLMDTVHILESDNPNSAQELYLLAYQSEFNSEYDEAIGHYKEIVSDYKDSSNASSCLARVFNCYEKKQATVTEYSLLESYYSALAGDTAHSVIIRNISEDLAIQSNIKQGNIEEAISDYEEIYTSNTNTPKGFHALINKEILSAGSGDNLNSGSTFEEIEFKQIKINALLKGLNARDGNANISTNSNPLSFDLLQNYPNPFNPTTKISFDLPIDSKVQLVVFDMLGREVLRLVNDEFKIAGRYEYEFNGESFPSGVYFYSLYVDGKQTGVKRMALVK